MERQTDVFFYGATDLVRKDWSSNECVSLEVGYLGSVMSWSVPWGTSSGCGLLSETAVLRNLFVVPTL